MPRIHTYNEVKHFFLKRGYILLSKSYKGVDNKLRYVCPKNHISKISLHAFLRGHGCNICAGMPHRTIDDIKDIFSKLKWIILSKRYHSNKQKLKAKCPNGHVIYIKLNQFLNGVRCSICQRVKKHSLQEVKEIFKNIGYTLLSKRYKNSWTPLKFECDKEHIHTITLSSLSQGQRCGKCFGTPKYTLKQIKKFFEERGWKLLSKRYVNNKVKLNVICDKGHKVKKGLYDFLKGGGCPQCYYLSRFGETNAGYNHNLSPEERLIKRQKVENREWILKVFNRDKFTCQVCNDNKGHNLVAHHLEGFHWCFDLRYDVNNGITLCEACHNKFHKKFWTRWNTSEQFYKFLRSFK